MPRVIAIANQKGGSAKTASTPAAPAERGRRVLAVDLDPQASLTFAMGVEGEPSPSMRDNENGTHSLFGPPAGPNEAGIRRSRFTRRPTVTVDCPSCDRRSWVRLRCL